MADEKSLKTLTTVVYGLQAAGFLVGITWIVAIVVAAVLVVVASTVTGRNTSRRT